MTGPRKYLDSPDGTQLMSGSGDHMIRIWDTLSARERAQIKK
jgi:hypothetical protein